MMAFRKWAVALSMAVLGFAGTANAGFTGDTVSVSLTAHTSGASDQVVFNNDPVTEPGAIVGDSLPNGVSTPLSWTFALSGNTFTITVSNPNAVATTVDPLALSITGIDAPVSGVFIVGSNDFGFVPGDISFTASTISVSAPGGSLAILGAGSSLSTTFQVVPEASTLIMMSLVASGLAGGYVVRRRKAQG
ncbi:PEP-CTERM sorting domain-containing protein [bacterium]|nr:PEP-CTERM sorting domain-containing protein [bacterium]